jgi:hypothetical protein
MMLARLLRWLNGTVLDIFRVVLPEFWRGFARSPLQALFTLVWMLTAVECCRMCCFVHWNAEMFDQLGASRLGADIAAVIPKRMVVDISLDDNNDFRLRFPDQPLPFTVECPEWIESTLVILLSHLLRELSTDEAVRLLDKPAVLFTSEAKLIHSRARKGGLAPVRQRLMRRSANPCGQQRARQPPPPRHQVRNFLTVTERRVLLMGNGMFAYPFDLLRPVAEVACDRTAGGFRCTREHAVRFLGWIFDGLPEQAARHLAESLAPRLAAR